VHPGYTLPILLDVGTENQALHKDGLYIGLQQQRTRGPEYDAFIEEFVTAVSRAYPKALIQWEDFGNTNAFRLLHQYRDRVCSFNDDIQGTASVALAGLLGSLRITGSRLRDQKLLFLGAGEAGTGIADLFVAAACEEGLTEAEARARCWCVDSQGLVVKSRPGKLAEHKRPYAHDHAIVPTLAAAVTALKPTALIGVSGAGPSFTQPIIEEMTAINKYPVIFALSNPTSKAECTAEQAYTWSGGRAIFASGSPFAPVTLNGRKFVPGQGNNVYIFPGVGLGALVAEASQVTDRMFLKASRTLAGLVSDEDIAMGRVYPSLTRIRDVSLAIATAVAEEAYEAGLARRARPEDLRADIHTRMFQANYLNYA
jgi:malate dehydrogenase (oxaloacetate-decarboxylating)(NADP+)